MYRPYPPLGKVETTAFNVFMDKYQRKHLDQSEDECTWRGRSEWEKLTYEQRKLFLPRPTGYSVKRRAPVPRKKGPPKPKKAAGAAKKIKRSNNRSYNKKHKNNRKPVWKPRKGIPRK